MAGVQFVHLARCHFCPPFSFETTGKIFVNGLIHVQYCHKKRVGLRSESVFSHTPAHCIFCNILKMPSPNFSPLLSFGSLLQCTKITSNLLFVGETFLTELRK